MFFFDTIGINLFLTSCQELFVYWSDIPRIFQPHPTICQQEHFLYPPACDNLHLQNTEKQQLFMGQLWEDLSVQHQLRRDASYTN